MADVLQGAPSPFPIDPRPYIPEIAALVTATINLANYATTALLAGETTARTTAITGLTESIQAVSDAIGGLAPAADLAAETEQRVSAVTTLNNVIATLDGRLTSIDNAPVSEAVDMFLARLAGDPVVIALTTVINQVSAAVGEQLSSPGSIALPYDDEPTGRAAVADGEQFLARTADPNYYAVLYRRVNAGTPSTPLRSIRDASALQPATVAEILAGLLDNRVVTPTGHKAAVEDYAAPRAGFKYQPTRSRLVYRDEAGAVVAWQDRAGNWRSPYFNLKTDGKGWRQQFADGSEILSASPDPFEISLAGRAFRVQRAPNGDRLPYIPNLDLTTPLPSQPVTDRLGSVATIMPFIIMVTGQSNAYNSGDGGSWVIDQSGAGIWIYSSLLGGSTGTMVLADFNQPPLSDMTHKQQMGPHAASETRRLLWVSPDRPIWVGVSAEGGRPLNDWVSAGVNSVMFARERQMLDQMQRAWEASGGVGQLKIGHIIRQQGEGDSDWATTPHNTDPTYYAGLDTLYAQYESLAYWSDETSMSFGECGRWRPYYTTSGVPGLTRTPGTRNAVIGRWASDGHRPRVALVTSEGLGNNGLDDGDASHFGGVEEVELGHRHARAAFALRLPGAYRQLPRTAEGLADTRLRQIVATAETIQLGLDDVAGGCIIVADAADLRLPLLATSDLSPQVYIDVEGASPTILRAPADDQVIAGPSATAASLNLTAGFYLAILVAGAWRLRALS